MFVFCVLFIFGDGLMLYCGSDLVREFFMACHFTRFFVNLFIVYVGLFFALGFGSGSVGLCSWIWKKNYNDELFCFDFWNCDAMLIEANDANHTFLYLFLFFRFEVLSIDA